jgi:hypothetical protein
MATYHQMVLPIPLWALRKIEKIARGFVWKGDDSELASGGHSLINRDTVYRPKKLGGLGLPNLERFGHALRLRWPWLQWTDPERPWVGSKLPYDDKDMALFHASTKITLGDGNKALFWQDNWTGRGRLRDIAPDLYKIATQKKRLVSKELDNNRWISSVSGLNTVEELRDFIMIANVVDSVTLDPSQPDSISWLWTTDGCYSAKSAYRAQFIGSYPR